MIGHHVPQCSCHIKVAAAFFHAHGFCDHDLNVINVTPVPDGLKDAVAEAENKDILHGFLAQIMVDAENLALRKDLADLAVQRLCRIKVIAERLFKYHAPPMAVFFTSQIGSPQMFHDVPKKSWTRSKIEKVIALRIAVFINLRERLRHSRVES